MKTTIHWTSLPVGGKGAGRAPPSRTPGSESSRPVRARRGLQDPAGPASPAWPWQSLVSWPPLGQEAGPWVPN